MLPFEGVVMRSIVVVLLLLLPGLAQSTPDSSTSREQVLKLFEVMHVRQQMRSTLEGVMKQQGSLVKDSIRERYQQVTDEEMAQLDDEMSETMKGMLEDMIPVYQKHLTPGDIQAMIAFYSSATGQKLMREMPAMTSEGMQAAYPRMQEQMQRVMQRLEEKMKQQSTPKKNSAPTAAPKSPQELHADFRSSTGIN